MLQPSDADPPERLGDWLAGAGAELIVVRPAVEGVPDDLAGVHGVVCMGGAMDAYDNATHPWLVQLRRLLGHAVASRLPVLGICLGGQLLAMATGGVVRRARSGPEAGARLVAKRDAAAQDPLFGPLPLTPDVIQFHQDEIYQLPPGSTLLASSPRYANQAFRVGVAGYGLQFHIETSPSMVLSWACRGSACAEAFPRWQLDPDHLEQVHADMARVWQPLAARFVAIAAGTLTPATGPGSRCPLPLLSS